MTTLYRDFKRLIRKAGSRAAAAEALGVSENIVSHVMAKKYLYEEALQKRLAPKIEALRTWEPKPRTKPVPGTARARMWQSMRILRTFSLGDIVTTATVGYDAARIFVMHLRKAGFVALVEAHGNGTGQQAKFRLVMNYGPRPPEVRRNGTVLDPNRGIEFEEVGHD